MKKWLVDVPIRINIWIRPECQKRQFEVIKQARPSIIFIQSDGGRNDDEWEKIEYNRKYVEENIDWDCKIIRIYENKNIGLYSMSKKTQEIVWANVDRCIFLEDDQVPSLSYFEFCAELLEKYKDDQRIECICGMNHLGVSSNVNSDYFFARQGSVWGTATWKRTFDEREPLELDDYSLSLLKQRTRHNKIAWKRLVNYSKNKYYEGHEAGGEFWIEFNMYSQNRLQIIPRVNMISNIGCTEDASHAASINKLPRGIRRVFNMQTYEMDFPIKHPKYVIPDIDYEKKRNRIMAYNRPMVLLYRRLEVLFIRLLAGELNYYLKRVMHRRKKNIQYET